MATAVKAFYLRDLLGDQRRAVLAQTVFRCRRLRWRCELMPMALAFFVIASAIALAVFSVEEAFISWPTLPTLPGLSPLQR
jgi:hypothetical protein